MDNNDSFTIRTNAVSSCGLDISEGSESPACLRGDDPAGGVSEFFRSLFESFDGVFAGVTFSGSAVGLGEAIVLVVCSSRPVTARHHQEVDS